VVPDRARPSQTTCLRLAIPDAKCEGTSLPSQKHKAKTPLQGRSGFGLLRGQDLHLRSSGYAYRYGFRRSIRQLIEYNQVLGNRWIRGLDYTFIHSPFGELGCLPSSLYTFP